VHPFHNDPDFASLSIKDLLEARQAYHVHLANLENVVGTAIGKYRIKKNDPDADGQGAPRKQKTDEPRTLYNSMVTKDSWPCVLVFVNEWLTRAELGKKCEQIVPPRLYLPDGRVIPTCVIKAVRDKDSQAVPSNVIFPTGLQGGGYPVLTQDQGEPRYGSVGCLVTDGHCVFALTNAHVAGDAGTKVHTIVHGERHRIGTTHEKCCPRIPFESVYPDWPGIRTVLNVDAGLIRVDDLREWTAQVFGIGEMGELINLSINNMSLKLIGEPVRAYGGTSGTLRGAIHGLFYRYRTLGGFDYVADFLIGPRNGDKSVQTLPGDSGTLWFWDPPQNEKKADKTPQLRPLAMQWGGHSFAEPGGQERMQFALATALSTVCRVLDVEIIQDWDIGHSEFWGKVGHYKIGAKACELVTDKNLKTLLMANQNRIAVTDADILAGKLPMDNQKEFVALADVPDLVWRHTRGMDKANHFADMDETGSGQYADSTLLDLWFKNTQSRTPKAWTAFYDSLEAKKGKKIADGHRGALPFRVRELYKLMVDSVVNRDVASYITATGVLAHYVGDACQPLHASYLHQGRPSHPSESKVHSVYETRMLDNKRPEYINLVNTALQGTSVTERVTGGDEAAHYTVQLMQRSLKKLPPMQIINAYNKGNHQTDYMWQKLKTKTAERAADGTLTLATLWQSAWLEGNGKNVPTSALKAVPTQSLMKLYNTKSFAQSEWLRNM